MQEDHLKALGLALVVFGGVVVLFLPLAAWGSVTNSRVAALVIYAWAVLPVAGVAFWPERHSRLLNPLTLAAAGGLFLALGAMNGTYAVYGTKAVFSQSWWHLGSPFAACMIPFLLAGVRRDLPRCLLPLSGGVAIAVYYMATSRIAWVNHVNGLRASGTPEIVSPTGDVLGCLSLPVSLGALLWLALVLRDERVAASDSAEANL